MRDKHQTCSCCYFENKDCLCSLVEPVTTSFKTVIIMNKSEFFRLSNSGKLLLLILKNCELRVRGLKDSPLSYKNILSSMKKPVYVLFPDKKATDLKDINLSSQKQNFSLLIPDGNWAQAAKIANKLRNEKGVYFIKISFEKASNYILRKNPNKEKLSTFESTLKALGYIDKSFKNPDFNKLFETFVDRGLKLRGKNN
ncbi:MAG: hypothetical protein CMP11_00735 [Zetaproteobacteria bacterium]|nr:hypothetical protein [Pseudobdellovibrionaceae bacterium]